MSISESNGLSTPRYSQLIQESTSPQDVVETLIKALQNEKNSAKIDQALDAALNPKKSAEILIDIIKTACSKRLYLDSGVLASLFKKVLKAPLNAEHIKEVLIKAFQYRPSGTSLVSIIEEAQKTQKLSRKDWAFVSSEGSTFGIMPSELKLMIPLDKKKGPPEPAQKETVSDICDFSLCAVM